MERSTARAIIRIAKELAGSLDASHISGQHGGLKNYSADYVLGLGVALGILWESCNDQPVGSAHHLQVSELLQWVRNIQQLEENRKYGLDREILN